MRGIFHKRKASASSANEIDILAANLHQQTSENNVLKQKIEDLKEASASSRQVFEGLLKGNEETEKRIQELKVNNQEMVEKIREQEASLKKLREIKFQLVTDKDTNNPQSSNVKEIQDLLDLVDSSNEELMFKDSYGVCWSIVKRTDLAEENYE